MHKNIFLVDRIITKVVERSVIQIVEKLCHLGRL
jgi:hypothetical protein